MSNPKSLVTQLAHNYVQANYWANETIVDWLSGKPADLLEKEVASSFAGIRETLVHIWDTDRYWLSVITNRPAPTSFRIEPFQGTIEEAIQGLLTTSREFMNKVLAMDEQSLS